MARTSKAAGRGGGVALAAVAVACASAVPQFPDAAESSGTSTAASSDDGETATSEDAGSSSSVADDTTTTSGSVGPTSDSGGSTTDPGGSTTGSTVAMTDTGPSMNGLYGPCPSGADAECQEGEVCIELTSVDGEIVASICGNPCKEDADCRSAPAMEGTPICISLIEGFGCALSCENSSCPDGMECANSTQGPLCVWLS